MPNTDDQEERDELDEELDDENEEETSDSGSGNSAPPDNESSDEESKTRINDLMSKWQKSEAKSKKLEGELATLKGQKPADEDAGEKSDSGDEFLEFARNNARETLFNSEPSFKEYGLNAEDISGDSLVEMKASFKGHQKRIERMRTLLQREILQQHGLDPEVTSGGSAAKGVNFAEMSDEDFSKFLEKRDSLIR